MPAKQVKFSEQTFHNVWISRHSATQSGGNLLSIPFMSGRDAAGLLRRWRYFLFGQRSLSPPFVSEVKQFCCEAFSACQRSLLTLQLDREKTKTEGNSLLDGFYLIGIEDPAYLFEKILYANRLCLITVEPFGQHRRRLYVMADAVIAITGMVFVSGSVFRC